MRPKINTYQVAPELFTNTVNEVVLFLTSFARASHPALSFKSATMYSHVPGPRAFNRAAHCYDVPPREEIFSFDTQYQTGRETEYRSAPHRQQPSYYVNNSYMFH